ncbi:VOC family protein [Paraburkholderia phosphatilytica]|uniref:VOC family protein n=1 Tax=Paraburkholderia phosphatilytica TaxID=2282883 RepID=UPI000E543A1D|nr:VOC family protein [Paraburkholderia phosphatilytica]
MSTQASNTRPETLPALIPHLICDGAAAAIEFYKKAFGATETVRLHAPNGSGKLMHASLQINGATVMLVDEMPEHGSFGPKSLKGTPVVVHLYVKDVDAAFKQAVDAGAKAVMPPTDMFWGDRYGQIEDPFGHRWSMATHLRDVAPEDMQKAMAEMKPECGTSA